jgi:hypothetical protein
MNSPEPLPMRALRTARRMIAGYRAGRDRGASAVEFALVSPLLFTLLFGVIDYGLYFADVLTVQQGVTDAVRNATLAVGSGSANWQGDGSCPASLVPLSGGATGDLSKVVCGLASSVQPVGGSPLLVKAEVVGPDGSPTSQWALGNRLRVCTLTQHKAVLPFVPMPAGGLLRTRVDMPIQPGNALLQLNPVAQNPASTGADWSWC